MATNKHAIIRYRELDRCFRDTRKKYFIKDLIKACSRALDEAYGIGSVSEKQIYDDIKHMKSEAGWSIELDPTCKDGKKKYYRYVNPEFSISNQGLNQEEIRQVRQTIMMLGRFKGMPTYGWIEELMVNLEGRFNLNGENTNIIQFEQNEKLTGLNYLSFVIESALQKQVLDVTYKTKRDNVKWIIHPYLVKQFNSRWYVLGLNEERGDETCIALDRVVEICRNNTIGFKENTIIDIDHYFDDVIGITIPKDNGKRKDIEEIILRFTEQRFPMVLSKPLHKSQRIVPGETNTISLQVIPNQELEQLIFSFGTDVEVISPIKFRHSFGEKIAEIMKKYFPLHIDCRDGV